MCRYSLLIADDSPVPRWKSYFVLLTLNLSLHLSNSACPQGVHLFVIVHVHPKADTGSGAIISMIQKVQSAEALSTVIGDFNHLNFQKVLERLVPAACHSPCVPLGGSVMALSREHKWQESQWDHRTTSLCTCFAHTELYSASELVTLPSLFKAALPTQTGLCFRRQQYQ